MEERGSISIFINPVSGGGSGLKLYKKIEARLDAVPFLRRHVEGVYLTPQEKGDVQTLDALHASHTVMICGGDGTVHQMVNLIKSTGLNRRISVFPLGTGNDFALGMGNDESNAIRHLRRIIERPRTAKTDIYSLNGKVFFTNYASIGLDAHILSLYQTAVRRMGPIPLPPSIKKSLFLLAGILALASYGKKVDEGDKRYVSILAANLRRYAGGSVVSQTSAPDDGMIEMVRMEGKLGFAKLVLSRYFPALHPASISVRPPVSINIKQDAPVQVDGEDYSGLFSGVREFTIAHEGTIPVCR